jgi:hypothetical protein
MQVRTSFVQHTTLRHWSTMSASVVQTRALHTSHCATDGHFAPRYRTPLTYIPRHSSTPPQTLVHRRQHRRHIHALYHSRELRTLLLMFARQCSKHRHYTSYMLASSTYRILLHQTLCSSTTHMQYTVFAPQIGAPHRYKRRISQRKTAYCHTRPPPTAPVCEPSSVLVYHRARSRVTMHFHTTSRM